MDFSSGYVDLKQALAKHTVCLELGTGVVAVTWVLAHECSFLQVKVTILLVRSSKTCSYLSGRSKFIMTGTLPCNALARWPVRRDGFVLLLCRRVRGAKVWPGRARTALGRAAVSQKSLEKHQDVETFIPCNLVRGMIWNIFNHGQQWSDAGSTRQHLVCKAVSPCGGYTWVYALTHMTESPWFHFWL